MEYIKKKNGALVPQRVHTIVISVQHSEDIELDDMKKSLRKDIIDVIRTLRIGSILI